MPKRALAVLAATISGRGARRARMRFGEFAAAFERAEDGRNSMETAVRF